MQLKDNYKYAYINTGCASGSVSTQVANGNGSLIAIIVGTTANGTTDITDGSPGASATANLGSLKANITEGTYWFLSAYAQGLKITTGSANKVTVVYDPHN